MKAYCNRCGGLHEQTTAQCGVLYVSSGLGYLVPTPEKIITKPMPCGHLAFLVNDKWVCQTCGSWEVMNLEVR